MCDAGRIVHDCCEARLFKSWPLLLKASRRFWLARQDQSLSTRSGSDRTAIVRCWPVLNVVKYPPQIGSQRSRAVVVSALESRSGIVKRSRTSVILW